MKILAMYAVLRKGDRPIFHFDAVNLNSSANYSGMSVIANRGVPAMLVRLQKFILWLKDKREEKLAARVYKWFLQNLFEKYPHERRRPTTKPGHQRRYYVTGVSGAYELISVEIPITQGT